MKRYLIYPAVLLLAACTSGPVEEMPETARLVAVSFSKPDLGVPVVLTRADETPEPAPVPELVPLPEGATVRIRAYFRGKVGSRPSPADFSTAAPSFEATYEVEADGSLSPCQVDDEGVKTAGETEKLIVRSGVYDFYAVSPARALVKSQGTYRIMDIPHKEDVMTSFARGVTITGSTHRVRLETFRRRCALVVFTVAPSKDNVLPFSKLSATRLTISRISSSGATLAAGEDTAIPATGGADDENAVVTFGEDEFEAVEAGADPDGAGLNKTKGVLLPKTDAPFDVEIGVQRDGETATLRATIDKKIPFCEGQRYLFTLRVKNNESRLQMQVQAWNDYVFTFPNVGAPDVPYPDPDITTGTGTEITVASWKEIVWSSEAGGE